MRSTGPGVGRPSDDLARRRGLGELDTPALSRRRPSRRRATGKRRGRWSAHVPGSPGRRPVAGSPRRSLRSWWSRRDGRARPTAPGPAAQRGGPSPRRRGARGSRRAKQSGNPRRQGRKRPQPVPVHMPRGSSRDGARTSAGRSFAARKRPRRSCSPEAPHRRSRRARSSRRRAAPQHGFARR